MVCVLLLKLGLSGLSFLLLAEAASFKPTFTEHLGVEAVPKSSTSYLTRPEVTTRSALILLTLSIKRISRGRRVHSLGSRSVQRSILVLSPRHPLHHLFLLSFKLQNSSEMDNAPFTPEKAPRSEESVSISVEFT